METLGILEDLRQDGRVESTGRFTLDAAKAREKMKKYQLQDPHEYVLQVVECAVAAGASDLDLQVDADDCRIRSSGWSLGQDQLQNLFSSLFGADRDAAGRSLRALAISLNSALALDPAEVRLDSWSGTEGWTLFVDPGTERVERLPASPWPAGRAGVGLLVRRRRSWRVLGRFLRGLVALQPEAQAVCDRCRWAPLPITVNGRSIQQEADLGEYVFRRELQGKGYRAVVVLPAEPLGQSRLELVMDGVQLEGKTLSLGKDHPLEVRAVIQASGLTRNASRSEVVEDEHWRALLADLRLRLRELVIELAGNLAENRWATPHLLRAIVRQGMKAGRGWNRWRELKQALLDAPLFPVAGPGVTALRPLMEQYDRLHSLPFVRDPDLIPPDTLDRLVPLFSDEFEAVLRSVFPQCLDDHKTLQKARERARRVYEWRNQPPREPALELGDLLVRVPLVVPEGSHPSLRGEVGLLARPAEASRCPILLFKEARPLLTGSFSPPPSGSRTAEARLASWPDVASAVNHDLLEPDEDWTGVLPGQAVEQVAAAVEATMPSLFEALAGAFPSSPARAHRARLACIHWLVLGAAEGRPFDKGDELPPALASLPLFPTWSGALASVRDLASEVDARGLVAVLAAEHAAPSRPPDRMVLRPSPFEFRALEDYLGTLRLLDYRLELERQEQKARFLDRPVGEPRVPEPVLARVPLEGRDVQGEVALPLEGEGGQVVVLHQGRELCRKPLPGFPSAVAAVVDAARVQPTADWSDLVPDAAWNEVQDMVRDGARGLPEVLAPVAREGQGEERERALDCLWSVLAWEAGPRCDGFFGKLDERRRAMLRLACFPTIDGRWRSLEDLLEFAHEHEGKVDYATARAPGLGGAVLDVPPALVDRLRGILGSHRLRDAGSRVEVEAPQEEEVRVPPGPWLGIERVESARCRAQVGLFLDPSAPSHLFLYHDRRLRSREEVPLPVGVVAAVELAARDLPQRAILEVVTALASRLAASLVRARRADPEWRRQVLLLAGRVERFRTGWPLDDLLAALAETPLLRSTEGPDLPLGQLQSRFARERKLVYLSEGHDFPADLVAAAAGGGPVPLLSRLEVELLSRVLYPLEDLAPAAEVQAQARRNRQRPRADLHLEARFPGTEWIARCSAGEGLAGEIGLPALRPSEPGVALCVEGLELARLDLHPGPGFLGIVDGPFQPTPAWDGLARPAEVRSVVEPAFRRLAGELVRTFPSPGEPGFLRAREVLMAWTDWARALAAPLSGLERAMAELPLFPLPGGRFADMLAVGRQVRRTGFLPFCPPGENPPAGGELVFEVEPGSREQAFLASLAPGGLRRHVPPARPVPAPPPTGVPSGPAPSLEVGGSGGPSTPDPIPESGMAGPGEDSPPPPPPEEILLGALRSELRLLRESGHPELTEEVLEALALGDTGRGLLWSCGPGGTEPTLNRAHPFVQHLLATSPCPPDRLYFLISSFYSVLNRAVPEIEDSHERSFHRRLLETLLGAGVVACGAPRAGPP